jgi:hypothetical protein
VLMAAAASHLASEGAPALAELSAVTADGAAGLLPTMEALMRSAVVVASAWALFCPSGTGRAGVRCDDLPAGCGTAPRCAWDVDITNVGCIGAVALHSRKFPSRDRQKLAAACNPERLSRVLLM